MRHSESMFNRKLKKLRVERIMSMIGKSTTTGKIEKLFATYPLEADKYNTLEYFMNCYNFIRSHQSPAVRYLRNTMVRASY